MVHKSGAYPVDVREKMRGGEGSVTIHALEKALLPDTARLFARLVIAPGCSIGEHQHTGETELFYFVSGRGVVTDDGVEVAVSAGDTMTTPDGHSHGVVNTGDEDLVLVAVIVKQ